MNTSLFELFKIGIGPSSSHTVGPMRAALRFARELKQSGQLADTGSVVVELYGSLALTGIGHGTDRAVLLGLLGEAPETVDPAHIDARLGAIRDSGTLTLLGTHCVPFVEQQHLLFRRKEMAPSFAPPAGEPPVPQPSDPVSTHPNGMRFSAFDAAGKLLVREIFYSVGGGFILSHDELQHRATRNTRTVPYSFRSAAELLQLAEQNKLTIANLMLANEVALLTDRSIARPGVGVEVASEANGHGEPGSAERRALRLDGAAAAAASSSEDQIHSSILALWEAMQSSMARGIATQGILPGGLNVHRRAPRLYERATALDAATGARDPLAPLDWVSLFAIAVNEENAAGGRVVTAPTNGAAGVIPAIARYYMQFIDMEKSAAEKRAGLLRFFLTAAAIGILYKENASISGAEVGCQGEVGVACSMAAGGLVAALSGTNAQVEHAAEIAMEHNLGMTCDPIGGLVQIPCIERNAMGAVKAVNACRMAMHETEGHKLSLDQVIETMYRTGLDMQSRYKETSLAGLALNIIEC